MFTDIRQHYFPYALTDTVTSRPCTSEQMWEQIGPVFDQVFAPLAGFSTPDDRKEPQKPLGTVYQQAHHEHFLFVNQANEPVGWAWGDMLDQETFFMTNTGILPAYHRQGIYTAFLKRLLAYLHALGYERVTSKHQVNNRAVIIAKMRLGFNIIGVSLDERWGAQVELGFFFHDDRQHGFEQAYSVDSVSRPPLDYLTWRH